MWQNILYIILSLVIFVDICLAVILIYVCLKAKKELDDTSNKSLALNSGESKSVERNASAIEYWENLKKSENFIKE